MFDLIYRSLGLRAAAFERDSRVYHAIFETVKINQCSTRRCVAFGAYPTIIAWLFSAMADCEAGLVRDADGRRYAPAMYYRHVIDALNAPYRMFDQPVFLDAGSGSEGSIPRSSDIYYDGDRLPWAGERLREHGMDDVLAKLTDNQVATLSLHRDAGVLADIFGYAADHRGIAPWRAIEASDTGVVDGSLAPLQRRSSPHGRIKPPEWINLGSAGLTALCAPNAPAAVGTAAEVLHQYITRMAPRFEVVSAGWGLEAIAAVRSRLEDAPAWPDGRSCMVTIDRACVRGMVRFTPIIDRVLDVLRGDAVIDGDRIQAPLSVFRERGLVNTLPDLVPALDVRLARSLKARGVRAA